MLETCLLEKVVLLNTFQTLPTVLVLSPIDTVNFFMPTIRILRLSR